VRGRLALFGALVSLVVVPVHPAEASAHWFLSVSDVAVSEESCTRHQAVFAVRLFKRVHNLPPQVVTVQYATADGTAVAGIDYTPVSGTLTFTPPSHALTVVVPITDALVPGPDKTFTLTLSNPSGAVLLKPIGTATLHAPSVAKCAGCGLSCDDGNTCTSDSCSVTLGCRSVDVNACATAACGLGACGVDSDGDGLSDAWEAAGGIDFDCDGVVTAGETVLTDFDPFLPDGVTPNPHPSAEVGRKDIFVRYDSMQVAGSGAACTTPGDCGGHCADTWAPCGTSADCGASTCVSDQYCVGHCSTTTSRGCNTAADCGGTCSVTSSQGCSTNDDCPSHCSVTTDQFCRANADCPVGQVCGNHCSVTTVVACRTSLDCPGGESCLPGGETCTSGGESCVAATCAGHDDAPSPAALQQLIDAYASHGINLHIYPAHATLPHSTVTSYGPPIDGCATPLGHVGDAGRAVDFYSLKPAAAKSGGNQNPFIHYAVFGHFHTCDSGADCAACPPDPDTGLKPLFRETGLAELIGNDVIIASGANWDLVHGKTPPSDLATAGTLMHELGHNLGLDHGGPNAGPDRTTNFKPNYISVMNYSFQRKGISSASGGCPPADNLCKTTPVGPPRIDYSNAALATLDETTLDETVGINSGTTDITTFYCPGLPPGQGTQAGAGTGSINWACDADGGSETVSGTGLCDNYGVDCSGVDIDNNASIEAALTGADDWANLDFEFQCDPSGHSGDGPAVLGLTSAELDTTTAATLGVDFPVLNVSIDIRPGVGSKWIAPGHAGDVPVAILGSATLDIHQIAQSTLSLLGVAATRITLEDVNDDGRLDLVAHFPMDRLPVTSTTSRAALRGRLLSTQPIFGADSISVVPTPERE
jgi:hypothetical protein